MATTGEEGMVLTKGEVTAATTITTNNSINRVVDTTITTTDTITAEDAGAGTQMVADAAEGVHAAAVPDHGARCVLSNNQLLSTTTTDPTRENKKS